MLEQVLLNGLVAGGTYALVALGFGFIFQIGRFFHFTHGATYATGAYCVYFFMRSPGVPLWIAMFLGVLGAASLGGFSYLLVYKPLQKHKASPLVLLISSLGLLVVFQNLLSLIFGDSPVQLRQGEILQGINILGARATRLQVLTLTLSLLLSLCFWAYLTQTKMGRVLRAVASDRELSHVVGVNGYAVTNAAFWIGSALAGVAGILNGFDTDLTPGLGFNAVLMGVVAMIIGGLGSVPGALLGGLFVGLAQHIGVWKLPSQWQEAIVFVILILFLLFRPQGILGRAPLRKATL